MDHAAISRACAHAEFRQRFEEEDVAPTRGEGTSDGAADYTPAHYYGVGVVRRM